jgi:hypothetical protein
MPSFVMSPLAISLENVIRVSEKVWRAANAHRHHGLTPRARSGKTFETLPMR